MWVDVQSLRRVRAPSAGEFVEKLFEIVVGSGSTLGMRKKPEGMGHLDVMLSMEQTLYGSLIQKGRGKELASGQEVVGVGEWWDKTLFALLEKK